MSYDGRPLYPTKRCGHVRWLLKNGKAKVIQTKPFQIQLLYKEEEKYQTPEGQKTILGIDPGRENIGVAVITKNGEELFSAKIKTRNKEIPVLMRERRLHRSNRRRHHREMRRRRARKSKTVTVFCNGRKLPGCTEPIYPKDIINSESRFMNRKRPPGWITPTVRQLIQTHLSILREILKLIPIDAVAIEVNKFAFMKLDDSSCMGVDFQNGRLRGYKSKYEYIDCRQNHVCCLCEKEVITQYHHLVKTSEGGSDLPENLIGVCSICHKKIHKGLLSTKLKGVKKKYHSLSVLNTSIPYIIMEFEKRYPDLHLCTGLETYFFREFNSIPKDHNRDAACIAALSYGIENIMFADSNYEIKQYRNHDRQIIYCQTERTYYAGGKAVAKNRKTRCEQKGDSLQSWLNKQNITKIEEERILSTFCPIKAITKKQKTGVKKSIRIYCNPKRILPGASFLYNGKRFVMAGTRSTKYFQTAGGYVIKVLKSKCKIIQHNNGLVYL